MPGRSFDLTEEQIFSLPLDVLGIELLRDLVSNAEWSNNTHTWMLMANANKYSLFSMKLSNGCTTTGASLQIGTKPMLTGFASPDAGTRLRFQVMRQGSERQHA